MPWRRIFAFAICLACLPARADFALASEYYAQGRWHEAFDEFRLLAELGDHDAQFSVGGMYLRGQHVAADMKTAYAWISLAAENGNPKYLNTKQRVLNEIAAADRAGAEAAAQSLVAEFGNDALIRKMTPKLTTSNYTGPVAITKISPVYPRTAHGADAMGVVEVEYDVGVDGVPHHFSIVASPDEAFSQATIDALKRWRFQPASSDGKPVATYRHGLRFNYARCKPKDVCQHSVEKKLAILQAQAAKTDSGADIYRFAYASDLFGENYGVTRDLEAINRQFQKAADKGFSPAQYQLGKNLLIGRGGNIDASAAKSWLLRAASEGLADAQYLLGMEMLSGSRFARDEAAARLWLERAAASGYRAAQIELAWHYATAPAPTSRNPGRARTLIARIDNDYRDRVRLFQTRAATAAASDQFNDARQWQSRALAAAKEAKIDPAVLQLQLQAYQQGKAWTE